MDDLKTYDQAASDFQGKTKINILPLHTWDIYGGFFTGLSANIIDARNLQMLAAHNKWQTRFDFQAELETGISIVVTNPQIEIVYSSRNITRMNGYSPEEILGKSPKIFQGVATSKLAASQISMAIKALRPFEQTLINYHKNGTEYNCHIKGFPVFNTKGALSHFIAFEKVA